MEEFLARLKYKFNYSDDMIAFFAKFIPAAINYFGSEYEERILKAIYNCEIHMQQKDENINEYLTSYFGQEMNEKTPFLAGGFYKTMVSKKDGEIEQKDILYMISRHSLDYKPFDFTDEKKIPVLMHELCHLIKGYGRVHEENGEVKGGTGLIIDYFKEEDGKYVEDEDKIEYLGIEEAANELDTVYIFESMYGHKPPEISYGKAVRGFYKIYDIPGIREAIKKSQFNGDSEWQEVFGDDLDTIVSSLDTLVNASYVSGNVLLNKEKSKAFFEKLNSAEQTMQSISESYLSRKGQRSI